MNTQYIFALVQETIFLRRMTDISRSVQFWWDRTGSSRPLDLEVEK